jgi:hypothetical protein
MNRQSQSGRELWYRATLYWDGEAKIASVVTSDANESCTTDEGDVDRESSR